jgi:hypothetical protein
MKKDIMGEWGSTLSDDDYSCALAALGVLEARGTQQHPPTADPQKVYASLSDEFRDGERTPLWRGALALDRNWSRELWLRTTHTSAAALAVGWQIYRDMVSRRHRELPCIAVRHSWAHLSKLFDFDSLWASLQHPRVRLEGLILAPDWLGRPPVWHRPLLVGVPVGAEHAPILDALREARSRHAWVERHTEIFTVGTTRDHCDLLILKAEAWQTVVELGRISAGFVVCLDDVPLSTPQPSDYEYGRKELLAAGVSTSGRIDGPDLTSWFTELVRELSKDVRIHAAVTRAGRHVSREPMLHADPWAVDGCRLSIAKRQDLELTSE